MCGSARPCVAEGWSVNEKPAASLTTIALATDWGHLARIRGGCRQFRDLAADSVSLGQPEGTCQVSW